MSLAFCRNTLPTLHLFLLTQSQPLFLPFLSVETFFPQPAARRREHHISRLLSSCKAYINGAQVGCWVKHGVQGVAKGDQSTSKHLKESLAGCVNRLVREFTQIGAKDCDKFLCQQATTKNKPLTAMPEAAT